MKQRFYLYRRRGTYYLQDARPGRQQSLNTKDRHAAQRALEVKRQVADDRGFNQFLLKTCLTTGDPLLTRRTWGTVMDQMQTHGRESTRERCARAMRSPALASLRHIKLIETRAEDFLSILNHANFSDAHYLKRLHNLALGLGWLSFPVLAPRLWPRPQSNNRRGITRDEHLRVLAGEPDPERKLFYQFLWEVGASQSDAAALTAENIDWTTNCLSYCRMKTGERAQLGIGKTLAALLKALPASGSLFPRISRRPNNVRSADFFHRCKALGIKGVSLHSYRYAWAERAKSCGYPERFAQEALGHNSKAVHRAYARRALVMIPSMEEFAEKMAAVNTTKVVPIPVAA